MDDYPLRFDTVRTALRAAQIFYGAGKRTKTRALYEELLATHPDKRVEPIPGMDASDTVGSYIRRRLADPGLVELKPADNQLLHTPLRMAWRSPADLLSPEKIFLEPEGERPESCKNSFFTQASEIIECRDVSTGIPSWTINLSMIPGYIIDPIQYRNFRFARSGDKELRGSFAGKLLILHDHRNLVAVDHQQGPERLVAGGGRLGGQIDALTHERFVGTGARIRHGVTPPAFAGARPATPPPLSTSLMRP